MSTVLSIMRMGYGHKAAGKMVLVLGAFFDDSGTHTTSPFVVMGGVLGTAEQWDHFERAWTALLANPLPGKPPLRQFHLSPCRAHRGEFELYTRFESDHLEQLFRRIIIDIGFMTFANAVDKVAWDELVTGEIAAQLGDPLEFCLVKCIDQVIGAIRIRKPNETVDFWFDDGTSKKLGAWRAVYDLAKEKYPEISGIHFAPVEKVVALQAADTVAFATYQYNQVWAKTGSSAGAEPQFKDFLDQPTLSSGFVFRRDQIAEMVSRTRTFLASRKSPS
ncbi:MAG: DUF3800 domain-containing protein [Stellaceae bacterium]